MLKETQLGNSKIPAEELGKLKKQSRETRIDCLKMIQNAGSGNPASALSCTEILVWLLCNEMKIKKSDPKWELRDRLVLSKGHSVPVFYSIVSDFGWLDKEELLGFRCFNTRLQTHPDYQSLPCIDYTSGSLGQGLSAANGMALAAKYRKQDMRFFVLIGDGECQEGQIWEAAMTAGHYKLDNVIVIIDRNQFQQDSSIEKIMTLEPFREKWEAFNWEVLSCNGHDFIELQRTLDSFVTDKPKLIIANTIKGKGVPLMQGTNEWHCGGKKFTKEVLDKCLEELN